MSRAWFRMKKRIWKHRRTSDEIFGTCEKVTSYMTDKQIEVWWKKVQEQPAPRCNPRIDEGPLGRAERADLFQLRLNGVNQLMDRGGF